MKVYWVTACIANCLGLDYEGAMLRCYYVVDVIWKVVDVREIFLDNINMITTKICWEVTKGITVPKAQSTECVSVSSHCTQSFKINTRFITFIRDGFIFVIGNIVRWVGDNLNNQNVQMELVYEE
jgi:hypothetical protein